LSARGLLAAVLAATGFAPSIYPAPLRSRGGALAACPSPSGLEQFDAAAVKRARTVAAKFDELSEASDIRNSDRAFWPSVRAMWRSHEPGRGVLNQAVYGDAKGTSMEYAPIVRRSCGSALVKLSLSVGVGPRVRHNCEACISTLFFVERRDHDLVYYLY
jgi:hypothetical protein